MNDYRLSDDDYRAMGVEPPYAWVAKLNRCPNCGARVTGEVVMCAFGQHRIKAPAHYIMEVTK